MKGGTFENKKHKKLMKKDIETILMENKCDINIKTLRKNLLKEGWDISKDDHKYITQYCNLKKKEIKLDQQEKKIRKLKKKSIVKKRTKKKTSISRKTRNTKKKKNTKKKQKPVKKSNNKKKIDELNSIIKIWNKTHSFKLKLINEINFYKLDTNEQEKLLKIKKSNLKYHQNCDLFSHPTKNRMYKASDFYSIKNNQVKWNNRHILDKFLLENKIKLLNKCILGRSKHSNKFNQDNYDIGHARAIKQASDLLYGLQEIKDDYINFRNREKKNKIKKI